MNGIYTRRLSNAYNQFARTNQRFDTGYALASHGLFNREGFYKRTSVGELVYEAKYRLDRSAVERLAELMLQVVQSRLREIGLTTAFFDVVVPVPPSRLDRPFQPVFELARHIATRLNLPCDETTLVKREGQQVKSLKDYQAKYTYVRERLYTTSDHLAGKRVLVIDDIIDSGATMDAVADALKAAGAVQVHPLVGSSTVTKN